MVENDEMQTVIFQQNYEKHPLFHRLKWSIIQRRHLKSGQRQVSIKSLRVVVLLPF